MSDQLMWSTDAWRRHKSSSQSGYKVRMDRQKRGPFLEGHYIVIPSEIFHPEIAAFFRAKGFRYNGYLKEWRRDTRRKLHGRTYTDKAWLEASQRKFTEIWKGAKAND